MTLQDIAEMNAAAFELHNEKFHDEICEETRVALEQLIAETLASDKSAT